MAILQLIACPRTLSTALMYSFAQREDMSVVDEPFYANYLHRTGKQHPGREEVLLSQSVDLLEQIDLFTQQESRHVFVKNIAHHLHALDLDYLLNYHNILYLREPRRILTSIAKIIPQPTLLDIGIKVLHDTLLQLQAKNKPFLVLNSSDLLADPKPMLKLLCTRLDIPFDPAMLHWNEGPKPYDGVWAKYWYKSLHKTSGFGKENISTDKLPAHLELLCEEATEYYNTINQYKLKIE